jgi:hypothetical protein
MGKIIDWWCGLLGVTDPAAIQVAAGLVSGTAFILAVILVVLFFVVALVLNHINS